MNLNCECEIYDKVIKNMLLHLSATFRVKAEEEMKQSDGRQTDRQTL